MIKLKINNNEREIEFVEQLIKEIKEGKISSEAQIQSMEIFGDNLWRVIGRTLIYEKNSKDGVLNETKKNIYNEEKIRFEAQKQLKSEEESKKIKNGVLGCLSLIAIIIIISLITGVFKFGDKTEKSTSNYATKNKAYVTILDKKSEYRYGYLTVTGTVKNLSNNITAKGVRVLVVVYDSKRQTKLAEDWSYIAGYDLKPNEQAAFEVMSRVPGEPYNISYSLLIEFE